MPALKGILSAEAADPVGIGDKVATAGALQHFCACFIQVRPEILEFDHQAGRCDWHSHLVLDLCLPRSDMQGQRLQSHTPLVRYTLDGSSQMLLLGIG